MDLYSNLLQCSSDGVTHYHASVLACGGHVDTHNNVMSDHVTTTDQSQGLFGVID